MLGNIDVFLQLRCQIFAPVLCDQIIVFQNDLALYRVDNGRLKRKHHTGLKLLIREDALDNRHLMNIHSDTVTAVIHGQANILHTMGPHEIIMRFTEVADLNAGLDHRKQVLWQSRLI